MANTTIERTDISILEGIQYSDITHAYSWDRSDLGQIQNVYKLIREYDRRRDYSKKRQAISEFEQQLERVRNDQTSKLEPIDIIEKEDRITNSGRTRAAELIAGEAANRFDFAAVGTSQSPVSDSDYALGAEVSRINLKLSGYASASGAVIKHSALWTPGLQSATLWEFAPVDVPVYEILQMIWARVVFPANKGLVHVANEDFFTITHSTYTQSLV